VQVRGCNVTAHTATQLADWSPITQNTGLINTIRVLDLGDNPEISVIGMEDLFGQMKLWEL
jgi:hypothetical protein